MVVALNPMICSLYLKLTALNSRLKVNRHNRFNRVQHNTQFFVFLEPSQVHKMARLGNPIKRQPYGKRAIRRVALG